MFFGSFSRNVADLPHHAVDLAVAGGSLHAVETGWIAGIVDVHLGRGEADVLNPGQLAVGFGAHHVVHVGVAIHLDTITEFAVHQLVDG
jgi:hypothetical protein